MHSILLAVGPLNVLFEIIQGLVGLLVLWAVWGATEYFADEETAPGLFRVASSFSLARHPATLGRTAQW
jgi:hypothetical protein